MRLKWNLLSQWNKPEVRWLFLFGTLPLVTGSALAIWGYQQRLWLQDLSWIPFVGFYLILAFPISFSLIPNTITGLLTGYIFGWKALPGMVLTYGFAAVIGYFFSKKIDHGLLPKILKIWPKAGQMLNHAQKKSLLFVMAFRLLPAPPFAIGNLLLAWLNVPFITYMIGSILGMLPRMTLVVAIGKESNNILHTLQNPSESTEIQVFTYISLVIALALGLLLFRRLK